MSISSLFLVWFPNPFAPDSCQLENPTTTRDFERLKVLKHKYRKPAARNNIVKCGLYEAALTF